MERERLEFLKLQVLPPPFSLAHINSLSLSLSPPLSLALSLSCPLSHSLALSLLLSLSLFRSLSRSPIQCTGSKYLAHLFP